MKGTEPVELFTAIYAMAYGLLVWALGAPPRQAALSLIADVTLAAGALVVLPRLRRARSPVPQYFGVGLPMLAFYFIYRQSALALGQPDLRWHDAVLATFDRRFLPELASAASPLVREWLALGYLTYIPFLAGGTAALFVLGPRGPEAAAERMVRRVCLALACCYLLFVSFPVLGPRFVDPTMQAQRLGEGIFSQLARFNQERGMVRGASFPSAHIAATVVVLATLLQARPRMFWALLPVAISLAAGAVYLGYHYATDVVAGVVVAAAAVAIDRWWMMVRAQQDSGSRTD